MISIDEKLYFSRIIFLHKKIEQTGINYQTRLLAFNWNSIDVCRCPAFVTESFGFAFLPQGMVNPFVFTAT